MLAANSFKKHDVNVVPSDAIGPPTLNCPKNLGTKDMKTTTEKIILIGIYKKPSVLKPREYFVHDRKTTLTLRLARLYRLSHP